MKQAIIETNIAKFEFFMMNLNEMTIEQALKKSATLFNQYLSLLNKVLAEETKKLEKGKWRAVDGFIVLAAEICTVIL